MPTVKKTYHRPWIPVREVQSGRRTDNSKFYQSSVWRKFRKLKLQTNPFCEECYKKGIITEAKVVDHIIPISKGGNPLSEDNVQSLCSSCHNKKSGRESHCVK